MYAVDGQDEVIELENVPQSSIGAPNPVVLAGEHETTLFFYVEDTRGDWDGTSVRIVGVETDGEPVAIMRFTRCSACMFGPPNDEAFSGHPLARRGLRPYGAFEIRHSSWLRALERMNRVHEHHDQQRFFRGKRHLVFAFHDTTFECIAEGFTVELGQGSVMDALRVVVDANR